MKLTVSSAPFTLNTSSEPNPPPLTPLQRTFFAYCFFPFYIASFFKTLFSFLLPSSDAPSQDFSSYHTLYFSSLRQFSIVNLILAYSIPLLFLFFPALIIPVIFFRSLSFIAGGREGGGASPQKVQVDENPTISSQDVDYWLQRCSICFDSQLEFCLQNCRDQFCRDCFGRYITEVVSRSWGLSITKIKCPVCQDVISQFEWSRYVAPHIVDMYNQFNQPYRPFSRHCADCEEEVLVCVVKKTYGAEKEKQFKELYESVRELLMFSRDENTENNFLSTNSTTTANKDTSACDLLKRFDADYHSHLMGGSISVSDIYKYLISGILELIEEPIKANPNDKEKEMEDHKPNPQARRRKRESYSDVMKVVSNISSKLISQEGRPESWKELQFLHVASFRMTTCSKCSHELCLQCGEGSHHVGMTCLEYMQYRVDRAQEPTDILENIKWKLQNSKGCPNCCILISRDDGCHKVDCSHCGYRFCWICRNAWSEKCGFYQCHTAKNPELMDVPNNLDVMPEIGVPNVLIIQARLSPAQHS